MRPFSTLILTTVYFLTFLVTFGQEKAKNASFYYEQGENAHNAGRPKEALDLFNKCLQLDAGFYEAYTSRAAVKEQLGDWPGAVIDYTIYLDKFPESSETTFSRGLAHYQAGQYGAATEDFRRFLNMPDKKETSTIFYRQAVFGGGTDKIISAQGMIRDYIMNYLGLAESKLKNYETAIAYFDSALMINPGEADYYVHRGLTKQEMNDLRGAEGDFRKALEIDPDHALAYYNLGVLLGKTNSASSEAEEQLNSAIERNPTLSYSYLERAYYRMNNGNLKGALEDYNKAIELDNDDADSWVNRGLVKEKLKDLAGAYKDFTHAIELKQDFEKAWFCRGNVLSKMNKLAEAIEDYSVAILYYPSYGLAYYNRAVAEHRLGQLDKACEDVQNAATYGMKVPLNFKNKVCREE